MTICCPKCASSEGRSIEAIYRTPEKERRAIAPEVSRQSAPPQPRHPAFWVTLTAMFGVTTIATGLTLSATTESFLLCTMLSAAMTREALRYNRLYLPRLLDYWHRSIICTRCGEVFVPA